MYDSNLIASQEYVRTEVFLNRSSETRKRNSFIRKFLYITKSSSHSDFLLGYTKNGCDARFVHKAQQDLNKHGK